MSVARRFGSLVVALLLVLSAGCAQISDRKRDDSLEAVVKTYTKYIRWGYYDQAAGFIKRRDGRQPEVSPGSLKAFRVTRYRIVSQLPVDEQGNEVQIIAAIDAYSTGRGVVQTVRDDQLWYYDEELKRWFLDGDLPALFGR